MRKQNRALLAQSVEHSAVNRKVVGSIPTQSEKFVDNINKFLSSMFF